MKTRYFSRPRPSGTRLFRRTTTGWWRLDGAKWTKVPDVGQTPLDVEVATSVDFDELTPAEAAELIEASR